jgi:hypothetical protein
MCCWEHRPPLAVSAPFSFWREKFPVLSRSIKTVMSIGTSSPFTQFPNAVIALMPDMSEAELRVTIAIARQTFGWHRERAVISLSDFEEMTGLSRPGVSDGIKAGMARRETSGLGITRIPAGQSYSYRLLVKTDDQSTDPAGQAAKPELVNSDDQPSQRTRPELVNVGDQQSGTTSRERKDLRTCKERERKNIKERRKDIGAKQPSETGTPVPNDFVISTEMKDWASREAPSLNIEAETEKFIDHYLAKGTVLRDWVAMWRNWMRRATNFQQDKGVNRYETSSERTVRVLAQRDYTNLFGEDAGDSDGDRQVAPRL